MAFHVTSLNQSKDGIYGGVVLYSVLSQAALTVIGKETGTGICYCSYNTVSVQDEGGEIFSLFCTKYF